MTIEQILKTITETFETATKVLLAQYETACRAALAAQEAAYKNKDIKKDEKVKDEGVETVISPTPFYAPGIDTSILVPCTAAPLAAPSTPTTTSTSPTTTSTATAPLAPKRPSPPPFVAPPVTDKHIVSATIGPDGVVNLTLADGPAPARPIPTSLPFVPVTSPPAPSYRWAYGATTRTVPLTAVPLPPAPPAPAPAPAPWSYKAPAAMPASEPSQALETMEEEEPKPASKERERLRHWRAKALRSLVTNILAPNTTAPILSKDEAKGMNLFDLVEFFVQHRIAMGEVVEDETPKDIEAARREYQVQTGDMLPPAFVSMPAKDMHAESVDIGKDGVVHVTWAPGAAPVVPLTAVPMVKTERPPPPPAPGLPVGAAAAPWTPPPPIAWERPTLAPRGTPAPVFVPGQPPVTVEEDDEEEDVLKPGDINDGWYPEAGQTRDDEPEPVDPWGDVRLPASPASSPPPPAAVQAPPPAPAMAGDTSRDPNRRAARFVPDTASRRSNRVAPLTDGKEPQLASVRSAELREGARSDLKALLYILYAGANGRPLMNYADVIDMDTDTMVGAILDHEAAKGWITPSAIA